MSRNRGIQMAKPTEVTIKAWGGTPFALKVGDTVLQETRYSGFDTGPPIVTTYTVLRAHPRLRRRVSDQGAGRADRV